MGSFVFKWPHPNANEVYVTGTFDDWGKTTKLDKVGETWEKDVDLPANDTKYLYKFVVDGDWVTDHTAPKEDDGNFNVNNVLHPENIKPKGASGSGAGAGAAVLSSAAPGSTTAGLAAQQPLESSRSSPPGAFPETPSNEPDTFNVQPIPASSGVGNPNPGDVQINTVDSAVTTSKEDYEKAGSAPEAPEPQTVGVNPIPASSGVGNPQPGDVQSKSIGDSVTTSKEDYEKSGSSALPAVGGALAAAGASVAAAVGFSSKKDEQKNLIPESSLPIGEKGGQTLNAGPTLQSTGPGSTTAGLAAGVPLEPKREARVIDSDETPAADVPETVKESLAEAHQSPEAATSEEAVKEKEAVEKELTSKVPVVDSAGEPAPTAAAATSSTAPAPTEASPALAESAPGQSTEKTEAEDPTLADEPAVKLMNQNEANAGLEKPSDEVKTEAPSAPAAVTTTEAPKTETPSKETATTTPAPVSAATSKPTAPSSATSTPTPQEKKKKHRVSAFFKKIFD